MSAERGFSLIEVIVALAIVGFALSAGAAAIGSGMIGHDAARDAGTALAVAEARLAAAGVTAPLEESRAKGVFADRFDWQMTVAPYDDARPWRLYRVAVSVAWRSGHRRRELALSTLRLGPAPP